MKTVKKDVVKIKKDMNTIVSYFDKEYLNVNKRVERIETQLHIQTN